MPQVAKLRVVDRLQPLQGRPGKTLGILPGPPNVLVLVEAPLDQGLLASLALVAARAALAAASRGGSRGGSSGPASRCATLRDGANCPFRLQGRASLSGSTTDSSRQSARDCTGS